MLSIIDRKSIEVAGLLPLQVDDKIAGIHKTVQSLIDLAKAYGYSNIARSGNVLALHNALKVIPVAVLCDDLKKIEPIYLMDFNKHGANSGNIRCLIETIINKTGFTPRIVDISNVICEVNYPGTFYNRDGVHAYDIGDRYGCFSYLFYGCETIKCIDMQKIGVKEIHTMECTFAGCESIRNLDLSAFDASELTIANGMFDGCKSLETLDLSSWSTWELRESEAEDMFRGCNSLKSVIINKMDNPVIVNEIQKLKHVEIVEPQ